jgi:5'-nucleotidase
MDTPPIDWSSIDTVLLDMDGTLLDLRFDNWFWQEHVPHLYGAERGLTAVEAWRVLEPKFHALRGCIEWYCVDHWSRELQLDIPAIKRMARERVGFLPGAQEFLSKLKASGKRRVLVNNAHPVTLAIKDERVGLTAYFDACYSTNAFQVPKESANFWPRLQAMEPFVPERTLFVDDSLPVLHAAQAFGIGWICAVRRPDSGQPPQNTGHYRSVNRVADLFD